MDSQDIIKPTQPVKKTNNKFALIAIVVVVILFSFFLFSSSSVTVSLDAIPSTIDISSNKDEVKLKRGGYVYTLEKVREYKNENFLLAHSTVNDHASNFSSPNDAYTGQFMMSLYDRDTAELNMKLNEGESVEFDMSTEEGKDMYKKISNPESSINVYVLPANGTIKREATNLCKLDTNDVITISGVYYKHVKLEKKGKEIAMFPYLSRVDVLYITSLDI